jgi:thiol-disulfide isomerase/thioredoxin
MRAVWGIAIALVAWAGGMTAAEPAVRVRLVDYDGLMAEVKKHEGKVVVLDCWSTSCPPCVKEFPGLVALADKHGASVVCLSLAIEYDGFGKPEECLPPVKAFLDKVGADRVVNFVASEEADAIYKKLDLTSVPAVSIWKPDGSLATRYDDDMAARTLGRPFTYADVEKTVAANLPASVPGP